MRLAAQAKLGFYAAHPDAVRGILAHLGSTLPPEQTRVIDPCCGKGEAIAQISEGLGIPFANTYAVELDAERVELAKARLPGGNVIGPASFMGTKITDRAFSLAYVNPPFDHELGGGKRQEFTFAVDAARLLVPGGILVLVLPEGAIFGKTDFQQYLDSYFGDAAAYEFPAHVRDYKEIVYIARKKKLPTPAAWDGFAVNTFGWSTRRYNSPGWPVVGTDGRRWDLPQARYPKDFAKSRYTEDEIVALFEGSPLNKLMDPPKAIPRSRPPLPLHKGHVAILLASGMLDGVVHPPGHQPHVVRGTARKETFLADKSASENPETGVVTEKEVWSQKIVLTVRAVDSDGNIKTFADSEKKAADPEPEAEPESGWADDDGFSGEEDIDPKYIMRPRAKRA